jgi:hypothetical protein
VVALSNRGERKLAVDEGEGEDKDGVIVDGTGWSWFGLNWML